MNTCNIYRHGIVSSKTIFWAYFPEYFSILYNKRSVSQLDASYEDILSYVKRLPVDTAIIDVGANSGLVTIPLALLGYKVVAVEPVRINLECLKKGLLDNEITDVQVVEKALADSDGQRDIYVPQAQDNTSFDAKIAVANMPDKSKIRVEQVDCTTLDHLARELTLDDHPVFIKIDVQGFEYEVLMGAKDFLSRIKNCHVLLEIDDSLPEKTPPEHIENLLIGFGFSKKVWPHRHDRLFVK